MGLHKPIYKYDAGRDSPIRKSELGILYFSDEKVVCGRCGFAKESDMIKHSSLPELILSK